MVALCVSLVSSLSSCGGGKSQTPEAVSEKYLAAFLKQDFATMKQYASEKELKNIGEQEAKAKEGSAEKKELLTNLANAQTEIQPAVIDENTPDKANVNVHYKMNFNGKESSGEWKIKLVKEEKEWKVDGMSLK